MIELTVLSVTAVLGCLYGILIFRNKFFPYRLLEALYARFIGTTNEWSIGLYGGASPLDLAPVPAASNPVLTARDVTDVDARFVADPFLVREAGVWQMFFEVCTRESNKKAIGLAVSSDGLQWDYRRIVLEEPFQLAYPFVFAWNGGFYMTPECELALAVRLYKAVEYPDKWVFQGDLLRGYHFADPTVFEFGGRWWMFVSTRENDLLNLYHAEQPIGPWTQHPASPVVRNNRHFARPGGRPLVHEGRLFRFAQDDDPVYGKQLFVFEITTLTTENYQEQLVTDRPLLGPGRAGWNACGMHHVDHQQGDDGRWLAAVDGWRKRRRGSL